MLLSVRRFTVPLLILSLALAVSLVAVADDSTSEILIVCPDSVSAPQFIQGYATQYTPPCHVSAFGPGGLPVPGYTSNPFLSGIVSFCYATFEPPTPYITVISARDSNGKTGGKAVLVTP